MLHPTAQISKTARLGRNVTIGAFTIVHDNVQIEDNCHIGAQCEIGTASPLSDGTPLKIGEGSVIRSHSVFYEGSSFGPNLTTGHHVTVREGVTAGRNLQIGTQTDIQNNCRIGECTRMHSGVFVAPDAVLGRFVWLMPHVALTNDPHPPSHVSLGVSVDDYAVISARSVILPGVTVGRDALVGANSTVTKDVDAGMIAVGSPARSVGPVSSIQFKAEAGRAPYPWRRHFHRGYPADVVETWKQEFPEG
ncbi:MAG: acyltransferase [Pseudomonadota bacterium]